MFDYNMFILSRQKQAEYDARMDGPWLDGLDAPLWDDKPNLVQRLLAALRGVRREPVPHPGVADQSRQAHTGAVAK
jgi:hypothetical protein